MTEPNLITGETTATEFEELLAGARLTLYGSGGEWNAVVWMNDEKIWGTGKGSTWYQAADRALRSARGKAER